MVIERLIEYLTLDSILKDYKNSYVLSYSSSDTKVRLADSTTIDVDIKKLKARIAQIQKEILIPYALTTTGNSN